MYHRKLHKYKEYERMENIAYGQGELYRITTKQGVGWRTPSGFIIYDENEAWDYVKRLDRFIRLNQLHFTKKRLKNRPS